MLDFEFYNPTRIVFGKDAVSEIHALLKDVSGPVLFLYGGGSIKKTGLYDRILAQLEGHTVIEYAGIKPNPEIGQIRDAVEVCRKNGVSFILAAGGGSVMDSAKLIGAGALYDGDVWDFLANHDQRPDRMVPVGTVVTLAGTGSEVNQNFVCTNPETMEKIGKNPGDACYPTFAICDPQNTYSVSKYQTASGAFDTICHVFEHYFDGLGHFQPVTDGFEEAIIRTVLSELPKALEDPENYEARANLMMASQQALFGVADMGKGYGEHVEHKMEHILSAKYGCAHGAGLAVVATPWRRFMCRRDPSKYRQLAENVFHVDTAGMSDLEAGMIAVDKLREFIIASGLPVTLREIGAKEISEADELAQALVDQGHLDKDKPYVTKEALLEMYRECF